MVRLVELRMCWRWRMNCKSMMLVGWGSCRWSCWSYCLKINGVCIFFRFVRSLNMRCCCLLRSSVFGVCCRVCGLLSLCFVIIMFIWEKIVIRREGFINFGGMLSFFIIGVIFIMLIFLSVLYMILVLRFWWKRLIWVLLVLLCWMFLFWMK